VLKVLVCDKVFIICALLDFSLIMGTHYMMTKYNWCTKGIALCGRYTTGTLTILGAATGWCAIHADATATECIAAFWSFAIIAGISTVLFYLMDGMREKVAAEADLRAAGLAVGD